TARAAANAPYRFTVPAGQKIAVVLLQSASGVPGGILHGPGGRTIDASGSGVLNDGTEFAMHLAQAHQTEIEIAGANAGQWTMEPAPGSPAITLAEVSHQSPPPAATGRVTGAGSTRTLHYTLTNIPAGDTVTLVERGDGGGVFLGRTRGSHGSVRFTPSDAKRGSRTILALLSTPDGTPAPSLTVTRYVGSPPRPGRASHVVVRRVGSSLRIRFTPAANATHQVVSIRLSTGIARPYILGAKARSLTIGPLPRRARAVSVLIYGTDDGLRGPAARG
ncbi:MAG TPA: hypothetical protein VF380_08910, partial [Solirubrobacteraceae bacterium]